MFNLLVVNLHKSFDTNDHKSPLIFNVSRILIKLVKKFQVLQETHNETVKRANEQHAEVTPYDIEVNSQNCDENLPKQMTLDKEYASNPQNHTNSLIKDNNHNFNTENNAKTREPTKAPENCNRRSEFDIEGSAIDKCGRLLHIESHTNGVLYDEYILKLSKDREIKIKYPVSLNHSEIPVKIEFVDDENEYEKILSDGMVILFKHIYAFVNVKQTGIPCSTQTTKTKTVNNFAQTAMTGINSFSRLNVGATVSEHFSEFFVLLLYFQRFYCLPTTKYLEKKISYKACVL